MGFIHDSRVQIFNFPSSPTEANIKLGVKFYPNPSTFMAALAALRPGGIVVASQLAGDFTLPRNQKKKLVFIAGGIGITPFRSMIKYIADADEERNVVLVYANKTPADIAYADEFASLRGKLFLKTIYTITDPKSVTTDWRGKVGMFDVRMLAEEIPDFRERMFYISGPHGMVSAYRAMLEGAGVHAWNIKEDFFPGFA
jgi:ferredoxin-NADP reductase